jgi:8-oxo-dGTP diphosphatase
MAKAKFTYPYPRPAFTADVVLFGLRNDKLHTLLIRRRHEPFAGTWALPGGFVDADEPVELAARRELREETGVANVKALDLVGVYGDPGRDPRGWTVSAAYLALVKIEDHAAAAGDDAAEVAWHPARRPPPLAFDHRTILKQAITLLRRDWVRLVARSGWLSPKHSLDQWSRMGALLTGELPNNQWLDAHLAMFRNGQPSRTKR